MKLEMLEDVLNHIRINYYSCCHEQTDHLLVSFCNTSQGIEITVHDTHNYQSRHFLYEDMVDELMKMRKKD